jgi:MFS transporter, DHA1 family, multidrug resistance protein
LLVLRVAVGVLLGGIMPTAQALVGLLSPPERRGMAYGVGASASAIGNGVGPLLGSGVAAIFGVAAVFLWTAPIFALAAIWIRYFVPRESQNQPVAKGVDVEPVNEPGPQSG